MQEKSRHQVPIEHQILYKEPVLNDAIAIATLATRTAVKRVLGPLRPELRLKHLQACESGVEKKVDGC